MLVSVVLTAHNEGIIAHKTILSLKNNLKILDQENISYEVIIHIDNGTKETNNYFSRFSREKNFKIVKNQFGDLGKSRNYAISIAQGKYIATLDADDLISPNYLADSVRLLENSALMCVAHPEYCLSFRTDNNYTELWQMHNSADSKAIDGYNLLDNNRWISAAVARREVFLKYPYKERINGYGHEDYIFNINTISDNIPHVVIKDSVYFYRQKNSSLNISSNQSNVTEPYSALFDFSSIKKASEAEVSRTHKTLRTRFIEKYIKLRNNKLANTIISPVAYMGKRLTGKRITASGQWRPSARVIDSWRTISKIETALYPTSKRLSNIDVYDPDPNHDIGTAYKNIAKNTNADKVDYIFIAPWLRTGGADKVIINYLKAFNELFPKRKIALITTVPGQNEWSDRLPKNTQLIDFGNESRKLNNYQKERLFTKIIVQLRSKYIHIINSEYGYLWAESHKELIRGNFILNLSLFCYDIIPGTNGDGRFDYADPYAVNVYDITRKIFTDNSKLADSLSALNGFDSSKFVLEYQPIDVMEKPKPKTWGDDKRHILWAGRICAQKNPEILKRIAQKLGDDVEIDIFGKTDPEYRKFFGQNHNIVYRGAFSNIQDIMDNEFDAFLYTSFIDGLPNILLEVAQYDIPIIATDVGGIGDLIKDKQTGLLVRDPNNADEFLARIKEILSEPKKAKTYVKAAKKIVAERHSWKNYLNTIADDFGGAFN